MKQHTTNIVEGFLLSLITCGLAFPFVASAQVASTTPVTTATTTATQHATSSMSDLRYAIADGKKRIDTLHGHSRETITLKKTLRRSMTGDEVRMLQKFLKEYGLLKKEAPLGYFGPLTQSALTTFQRRESLEPVGYAGPRTRNRIMAINNKPLWQPTLIVDTASSTASLIDAVLTNEVGDDGSGVGASTLFASTTSNIYAVVKLARTQLTTEVAYVRYFEGTYVDSGVAHPSRAGVQYLHFLWSLKNGETRTPGSYKITFYVNGTRSKTITYTIQ